MPSVSFSPPIHRLGFVAMRAMNEYDSGGKTPLLNLDTKSLTECNSALSNKLRD
jgi:hypothetical protein